MFNYRGAKEISFYYFRYAKLCAKQKKHLNSIHIAGKVNIFKVNEWYLVDGSHHEFMVSTQIMVRDYYIVYYILRYNREQLFE